MPVTALAMPIRVFCAPLADHAAEITDPPGGPRCGAGWSWPHRYGGASRVRKSIVPPGCWAGGPGASALRESGLTGSPDECTIRACGSAVTGPAASAGLTGFARSGIASWRRGRRNAPSRVPPSPPACAPAGSGTAVSAAGLRGDDLAGWDQVLAPVVPFPGQGDRDYAVASSSAPARRARISPMVRSRLSVSGSGRWAWIW